MPYNAVSERRYSRINVLTLWHAVVERGFRTHAFLTFRQGMTRIFVWRVIAALAEQLIPACGSHVALDAPEPDPILEHAIVGIDIEFGPGAVVAVGSQFDAFAQQLGISSARNTEQDEVSLLLADMYLHLATGVQSGADPTEHIVPATPIRVMISDHEFPAGTRLIPAVHEQNCGP
ncbi:ArdC family protein [Sphingomonas sp.]|uniref:ArdC family protein n=2 Tax=unclassified Sphingomonas TaxID=196159 RepID=UPI00257A34B0|nr:ArdC family protein [Sphingomonas sp.]